MRDDGVIVVFDADGETVRRIFNKGTWKSCELRTQAVAASNAIDEEEDEEEVARVACKLRAITRRS
jgi:hypothetical protein